MGLIGVGQVIGCNPSGRGRLGDAKCSCPNGESAMAWPPSQNVILSSLSEADFALLAPHLEPADLPLRKVLERPGKPIKAVYFPESGLPLWWLMAPQSPSKSG